MAATLQSAMARLRHETEGEISRLKAELQQKNRTLQTLAARISQQAQLQSIKTKCM